MAVKVRVRNFQSIEDASIVIDGLTVITGTNNAGKSAMFRAIKGALCNTLGTDFVRLGTTHCTVDLTFDDGKTLKWERGKNINTYTVNGKALPKFGRNRPEELNEFGVDPIQVGDDKLWPQIAPQFRVTFLLDKTGSAIADAVADVTRVNKLNKALKNCDKDRRKARGALKLRRKDGDELAQKRTAFEGLDDTVASLKDIESRWQKTEKFSRALVNIRKMAERWHKAKGSVDALDGFEDAAAKVPDDSRLQEAREVREQITEYRRLGKSYRDAVAAVETLKGLDSVEETLPSEERMGFASKFRQALGITVDLATRYQDAASEFELFESFEADDSIDDSLFTRADQFKQVLAKATDLQLRLKKARKEEADVAKQLASSEAELEDLESNIVEMFGELEECPTCGGGLDHVHEEAS
jgi:DNA repair ATPase RecN